MRKINIALDGHSSCGKSTIAKALAKRLQYTYVDTGAMYRGVTLWTLREGLWIEGEPNKSEIARRLGEVNISFGQTESGQHLLLNGEDVEREIRGLEVSNHVSPISTIPEVRKYLVAQQQAWVAAKGVVMDGRDVGTVVMPDAELKFFVTASPEVRAKRRFEELTAKGDNVSYEDILTNVTERDRIDSTRAVDPLRQAEDAILLDNSLLSREEQQRLVEEVAERVIRGNDSGVLLVEIDSASGFCFGVITAISKAESELKESQPLHSLGDIVHNGDEVKRLKQRGLHSITYERLPELKGKRVLFRAHGEAPKVYAEAERLGIEVVDATCPVVLALQKRIRRKYENTRGNGTQIVIYGKHGHAEVNGLVGQTNGEAIVVQSIEEAKRLIDPQRPVALFSQTTMDMDSFAQLGDFLKEYVAKGVEIETFDTICRQVSNRVPEITEFSRRMDWVYFIAGAHSSNGKVLYNTAQKANLNSYFVSSPDEITKPLPSWVRSVGVCGATSTPMWQMEAVKQRIEEIAKGGKAK
ncbi:4-hydroxy-3-methylbut-2-enyl diphosphate reductase [Porphyromonas levii]|uniref:Multifunctional fusion protein n=1 Tax=Porphyromonas levii TaxID=28114 RepID=A0A4Y8WN38_9PORP|nr:4-hydroxy-3-methylbut-2-enyl diphosphate reductase [Porphyromonas levii]TFH97491.1 4-hydroxy-3-methylbut-2-enyl diphosphate reductase [Porphyromonas levii]